MKKPSPPQSGSSRVPPSSKPSPYQPFREAQPKKAEENPSMHAFPPIQQRVKKGPIAWREMIREMGRSRRRAFEEEARLQEQAKAEVARKDREAVVNPHSSVLQVQSKERQVFRRKEEWQRVVADATRVADENRAKKINEQRRNAIRVLKEAIEAATARRKIIKAEREEARKKKLEDEEEKKKKKKRREKKGKLNGGKREMNRGGEKLNLKESERRKTRQKSYGQSQLEKVNASMRSHLRSMRPHTPLPNLPRIRTLRAK